MLLKWMPVLALSALVTACGGGGDDAAVVGGGGGGGSSSGFTASPLVAGEQLTGYFIDSPVAGLGWTTRLDGEVTGTGVTGFNGQFPFRVGEEVTFSLGGLVLGTAAAGSIMSPLALAGVETSNNPFVINVARLLQTLDADGNPANGIDLNGVNLSPLAGLATGDLSQDPATFAVPGLTLVSAEDAKAHLDFSLETVQPSELVNRIVVAGGWRIFGGPQGADGSISFTKVVTEGSASLGGDMTLREVVSCDPGARPSVESCTQFSTVPGEWYYDAGRRELVLGFVDDGERVVDRCRVLADRGGLIELVCREQLSDGSLAPNESGPAYLVRDVVDSRSAPSEAVVTRFWNTTLQPLEGGAGNLPFSELGSGVFRFDTIGAAITGGVFDLSYDAATATLSYSATPPLVPSTTEPGTFTVADPAPPRITCTLYNGMELAGNVDPEADDGNRAFFADCNNAGLNQIWILSPNLP